LAVVALQCLLTAWIVWLVVRSFAPRRTIPPYLLLILLLSALTGMSWYCSLIMPDYLARSSISRLSAVFARDTLSRAERLSLYPIACWAIASHSTHLLLSGTLLPVWRRRWW